MRIMDSHKDVQCFSALEIFVRSEETEYEQELAVSFSESNSHLIPSISAP